MSAGFLRRARRPVTTVEIAEAAALGDLAAATCVLARVVPAGNLGVTLAGFPLAVLGFRRRARVCALAVATAVTVAFLGGGMGPATSALSAGALGSLIGIGFRRGWSIPRIVGTGTLSLSVPASAVAVGVLAAFPDLRALALAQLSNSWSGAARAAANAGASRAFLDAGQAAVAVAVARWWLVLPVVVTSMVLMTVVVATLLFRVPLRRVQPLLPAAEVGDLDGSARDGSAAAVDVVAPLPVRLAQVGVLYEGSADAALSGVDLSVQKGRFVAVGGPNGAGKSTLGRVLAGQTPTEGAVTRPGSTGLGAPGGTGVIFQRPESQVLGVRVVDDLLWGADRDHGVDVDGLLERVGLTGFADRETATLSGGELQRLAVAALLARRPTMVISDESTAMLDPAGRAEVLDLMHDLVRDDGVTVVQISHHTEELAGDDTVSLGDDAVEPAAVPTEQAAPTAQVLPALRPPVASVRGARVEVRGAELVHDAGTPWERRVLTGVDLDVPAGHTVLVTGPNGAGKSTLAWLLAGLLAPTTGTVTLDGRPLHNGRDGALLGVQHPRLALLRATAGEDVRDAAGTDRESAEAALRAVGFDPGRVVDRPVHELSGGEQRRVVLAGLLAAAPRVLVLDEPLAGLDGAARDAVRDALGALRSAGVTLIIVTHDTDALDDLADSTLTVSDGRVEGPPAPTGPAATRPPTVTRSARRHTRTVMRTLPGTSPAHRLWAGTKIAVLLAVAVTPAVSASWPALGAAVLVLVAWGVLGRVPRGAWPRMPAWLLFWIPGVVLAGLSDQRPLVALRGFTVSLGGMSQTLLFLGITLVSLTGATVLVWTTPVSAVPPLLQRLTRAARRVRLPLARWSAAIALGLRMAPMLLDDSRTILALLGQRRRSRPGGREPWRRRLGRFTYGASIACATAARRANETGEAVTARGGIGVVAGPDGRPGLRDALAVLVVAAVLAAGILL